MQNFFTKLDSPTTPGAGGGAPPTQSNPDNSAPWWLRSTARAAGLLGGVGKYKQ